MLADCGQADAYRTEIDGHGMRCLTITIDARFTSNFTFESIRPIRAYFL